MGIVDTQVECTSGIGSLVAEWVAGRTRCTNLLSCQNKTHESFYDDVSVVKPDQTAVVLPSG